MNSLRMTSIFLFLLSSLLFSQTMEIHTGFFCKNDVIVKSSAIGKNGDILLAGEFEGGDMIYGKDTLTNWGEKDIFLACFDKNLKYKWMKKTGGTDADFCNSVAADSKGNIFLAGVYKSWFFFADSERIDNPAKLSSYILKLDPDGNVLFLRDHTTKGEKFFEDMVIDENDNIYAAGYFEISDLIMGDIKLKLTGGADILIMKLDGSNGDIIWAKSFGGEDHELLETLSVIPGEGIYAGGFFQSRKLGVGRDTLHNAYQPDLLFMKISADGEVEWSKAAGGEAIDKVIDICTAKNGDLLACGVFRSGALQFEKTKIKNHNTSGYVMSDDMFFARFSPEGKIKFAISLGGSENDGMTSIAEKSNGNIICGGWFEGPSLKAGEIKTKNGSSYNARDLFVVETNSKGKCIGVKTIPTEHESYAENILITPEGKLLITANVRGELEYDNKKIFPDPFIYKPIILTGNKLR